MRRPADLLPNEPERVFIGLGVSPGVAVGVAHPHEWGHVTVPEYCLPRDALAGELLRFEHAVSAASLQLRKLQDKASDLSGAAGEELSFLLEAYQQMLGESRLVRGVKRRILGEHLNAEAAVQNEISQIVQGFASMDDPYLAARIEDIREVGRRLVRHLTHDHPMKPFALLPNHAVILAEELSPADTALLNPANVAGMATAMGSTASHTAILARSLGLPAVVGIPAVVGTLRPGAVVIVDGSEGKVILNPTPATLAHYRKKRADYLRRRRALNLLRRVPAETQDGININLMANLELPSEIEAVLTSGAMGVGLLRSEFLYLNRDDLPDEDEQYQTFRTIIERLEGRPLTIRTLDAGADKTAPALGSFTGANPALGLRAIRLCLKRPDLLDTQLAAILRAGAHGPVRILVPMVCSVSEVVAVRSALLKVMADLRARNIPIASPPPPLGIMIEIPGAALAADVLARHSDFFAIGTNDLTQYTLAIDRTDEQVAALYNPLHPAVLRLIQFTAKAAERARIPVSVCGEIAGHPRYTALLLGLGIRDLSMASNSIPQIKQRVRSLTLDATERRVNEIMAQSDSGRIAELLDSFNANK